VFVQTAPRRFQKAGPMSLLIEPVAKGVTRFSETQLAPCERGFFYLVEGEARDCLIDAGWGLGWSLDDLPRNGTKPLVAVATHSHFDHIGGLHLVRERYGHGAEAAVFAAPTHGATQAFPYLAGRPVLADGRALTPATHAVPPAPLTGFLDEGDRLDLGGPVLDVLHTPGHSPGSLALLDRARGLLFCADTVHDGFLYDAIPGASAARLLASHRRLAALPVRLACPGHGALLDETAFRARIAAHARSKGPA